MSKVSQYLQEHLTGEVVDSRDVRNYFATDASVFRLPPAFVVYPRNENDIRKSCRFTWQLAERGRVLPMTARGAGTDQSGAALTSGIILSLPAHMNRIVELDTKSGNVVVEPGMNYGKLQQALQTHNRWLPPSPASMEYSTIGGAVANNSGGDKSLKYGTTRNYVRSLRVVLANGEVIHTERLSKKSLSKKLGLATFEGEIYRAVDSLLEDNADLIEKSRLNVTKNNAGYYLKDVKDRDGSLDLTPLIVGSQGTLGIVSEIELETEAYAPDNTLISAHFDTVQQACRAINELRQLANLPSAMELVDKHLLKLVKKINPHQLGDAIGNPIPEVVLLIEFDDASDRTRKKNIKSASKILDEYASSYSATDDPIEQEKFWKIRHATALVAAHAENTLKAVPVIDDGIVPPEKLQEYLSKVYALFEKHHLQVAVWGHAGDANIHLQPFLDLSQLGHRQKLFKLLDEYYGLVISLGGSPSGEHNDGRLRAPYLKKLYGNEMYGIFEKLKKIFDPYGTLNPGVKIDVTLDDIKPLVRSSYSLDHLYDHNPRS